MPERPDYEVRVNNGLEGWDVLGPPGSAGATEDGAPTDERAWLATFFDEAARDAFLAGAARCGCGDGVGEGWRCAACLVALESERDEANEHRERLVRAARVGMGYAATHAEAGEPLAQQHHKEIAAAIDGVTPRSESVLRRLGKMVATLHKEVDTLTEQEDFWDAEVRRLQAALAEAKDRAMHGCRQCWDVVTVVDAALKQGGQGRPGCETCGGRGWTCPDCGKVDKHDGWGCCHYCGVDLEPCGCRPEECRAEGCQADRKRLAALTEAARTTIAGEHTSVTIRERLRAALGKGGE